MEKARSLASITVLLISLGFAACSSTGCANRPCREPRAPELDRTKAPGTIEEAPLKAERVRVFKSDGSRQCEAKGGDSLEVMERQLAGIPTYSKVKRKDNLMHMQMCGSPTGMINLYEIDTVNLKQAEQRGFRRWEE